MAEQLDPRISPYESAPPITSTQEIGQQLPIDINGTQLNASLLPQGRYQKSNTDIIKEQQDRQQGIGTGQTIVAVLAALSGNFGPAIQIEEQKRKTALTKEITPTLDQIHRLRNAGELEKASDLVNKLVAAVGPRSPEIAQYLIKEQDRIAENRTDFINLKALHTWLKAGMTEDDVRKEKIDALGKFVQDRTPVSKAFAANILQQLEIKTQLGPNSIIQSSPASTRVNQIPQRAFADEKTVGGYVGARIGDKIPGLTPDMIVNIQRDVPILDAQGREMFSPEDRAYINKLVTQYQAEKSDIDLSNAMGWDPTFTTQMRLEGISPREMMLNQVPADKLEKLYQGSVFRNADTGQENIVYDVQAGQPVSVLPSVAKRNPQRYAVFNAGLKDILKNNTEILGVMQSFNILADALSKGIGAGEVPGIDNWKQRGASYINRAVNRYFGLDENTTYQQALQTIVKNQIETLTNKGQLPAARMAELTAPLTTDKLTVQGAQQTLNAIVEFMDGQYYRNLQQGGYEGPRPSLKRPTIDQVDGSGATTPSQQQAIGIARQSAGSVGLNDQQTSRFLSILGQESSYGQSNRGDGGKAYGAGQVHQAALTDVNRAMGTNYTLNDLLNPKIGIPVSAAYFKILLQRNGGDIDKATAAYNGGGTPGYVDQVKQRESATKVPLRKQQLTPVDR